MATGTIDFFNDTGGYGSIETVDEDDVPLKGPRATNVVRAYVRNQSPRGD